MQTCAWVGRFHFCYFFIARRCSVAASTESPPRAGADMSDVDVPISYRSTQTGDKEHAPLEDPVLPAIAAGADRYVGKLFAAGVIAQYSGSAPVSATVQVLKDLPLRLVARYDLALADGTTAWVVGKWYALDRGAAVASELEYLAGIGLAVAPLLGYWPAVRLLLTAWVPGRRLTELLAERADTAIAVARAAGRWAARLHSSDMPTPRSCGPAKQRASLAKWRDTSAEVA